MIPVITWLLGNNQLFQPFHTSSTNLSWDDSPEGFAVIQAEWFAVHTVREHDASVRIKDPVELNGGAVITIWLQVEVLAVWLHCVSGLIKTTIKPSCAHVKSVARRSGLNR